MGEEDRVVDEDSDPVPEITFVAFTVDPFFSIVTSLLRTFMSGALLLSIASLATGVSQASANWADVRRILSEYAPIDSSREWLAKLASQLTISTIGFSFQEEPSKIEPYSCLH